MTVSGVASSPRPQDLSVASSVLPSANTSLVDQVRWGLLNDGDKRIVNGMNVEVVTGSEATARARAIEAAKAQDGMWDIGDLRDGFTYAVQVTGEPGDRDATWLLVSGAIGKTPWNGGTLDAPGRQRPTAKTWAEHRGTQLANEIAAASGRTWDPSTSGSGEGSFFLVTTAERFGGSR